MMAFLSRVYTVVVPVTVGTAFLFSGSTDLRGQDVPVLKEENGPYMVMARVFRGQDAEKNAKALVTELRQEHKMPAYLFQDHHGATAVLVGDAKSPLESESILKKVRLLKPRCLADKPPGPNVLEHQPSLALAFRTTNPLRAAMPPIKKR
jgi:hypothetical protein